MLRKGEIEEKEKGVSALRRKGEKNISLKETQVFFSWVNQDLSAKNRCDIGNFPN